MTDSLDYAKRVLEEVSVGLAIIIAVFRNRSTVNVDELSDLRG